MRDRLAHGKLEHVVGEIFNNQEDADRVLVQGLQPDWYSKITTGWVIEAKERLRLLMIYLGEMFDNGEDDYPYHSAGGLYIDDGDEA